VLSPPPQCAAGSGSTERPICPYTSQYLRTGGPHASTLSPALCPYYDTLGEAPSERLKGSPSPELALPPLAVLLTLPLQGLFLKVETGRYGYHDGTGMMGTTIRMKGNSRDNPGTPNKSEVRIPNFGFRRLSWANPRLTLGCPFAGVREMLSPTAQLLASLSLPANSRTCPARRMHHSSPRQRTPASRVFGRTSGIRRLHFSVAPSGAAALLMHALPIAVPLTAEHGLRRREQPASIFGPVSACEVRRTGRGKRGRRAVLGHRSPAEPRAVIES